MLCGLISRRKLIKRLILVCIITAFVTSLAGTATLIHAGLSSDKGFYNPRQDLIVKPNFTSHGSYDVILSAYMNSGSRFTSRLLGFRPETFFFYEPLWKFDVWNYHKPPDLMCSTTVGSCRRVHTDKFNSFQPYKDQQLRLQIVENITSGLFQNVVPTDIILHVISSVYSCNLVPLKNIVQERVQDKPSYSGPSWNGYRECIANFHAKSSCLRQLEDLCRSSKHRVTKILRTTLSTFRPLMLSNPYLKIVHLVRDPRAIIHSRIYSRHYPIYGYRENSSLEANLCDKMLVDYKEGVKLMREFPDRIKFLYYEDLLTNLHVRLKQVMEFLNMDYNQTEVDLLAKVQVNLSPPEKGIDFLKDRKENNSCWWRMYMQQYDIDRVNKACVSTLRAYGYKPLYKHVRDLNYPSYSIPEKLRFSV